MPAAWRFTGAETAAEASMSASSRSAKRRAGRASTVPPMKANSQSRARASRPACAFGRGGAGRRRRLAEGAQENADSDAEGAEVDQRAVLDHPQRDETRRDGRGGIEAFQRLGQRGRGLRRQRRQIDREARDIAFQHGADVGPMLAGGEAEHLGALGLQPQRDGRAGVGEIDRPALQQGAGEAVDAGQEARPARFRRRFGRGGAAARLARLFRLGALGARHARPPRGFRARHRFPAIGVAALTCPRR